MLLLSRKKSETILIDGMIRVEVVNLARATVRVRLMAPRSLQLSQGGARNDLRDRQESPARSATTGMDVFHMTLVNQQVVALGESVSLGVVDADKSRAILFVDAPAGTNVTAVDPEQPDRAGASTNQILLRFMGQATDQAEPAVKPASETRSREDTAGDAGAVPDLLPFRSNLPEK